MFENLLHAVKEEARGQIISVQDTEITLTQDAIAYFIDFINDIVCFADCMQIYGKTKRMYQNSPYTTILNGAGWNKRRKTLFTAFVHFKFGDPKEFNEWILKYKYLEGGSNANSINFNTEEFNIIFLKVDDAYLECYARENMDCKQVKLVAESKDVKCYQEVINYLREIRHAKFLRNILDDRRVIEALKYQITCGHHIVKDKIKLLSNNKNDYCLAYVPLGKYQIQSTPAWDDFLSQIDNSKMECQFMAWVYGVFVDNDFNRQVLWIEGPGYCGKSTIIRVIGDFLLKFNKCLFQTVSDKLTFNTFSLEPFENCRLASFAEANEPEFFKRRDILTMTGGDYVSINRKNKPVVTKKLQVKVIVHSNYAPHINKDLIHERTRLLHIVLSPEKVKNKEWRFSPENFEQRLAEEFTFFLAKCSHHYDLLMTSKGLIENE